MQTNQTNNTNNENNNKTQKAAQQIPQVNIKEAVLRVYHKDVDKTLQNKKAALPKLLAFKEGIKPVDKKTKKSSLTLFQSVFLFSIFITVGIFAIYFANQFVAENESKTYFKAPQQSVVLADKTVNLDVTNLSAHSIKQLLFDASNNYNPPGTIVEFNLFDNNTKLTTKEFIKRLNLGINETYLDSYTDYFVGAFYTRFSVHPIIILKTGFVAKGLTGIKNWEYKAPYDLAPFFVTPKDAFTLIDPDIDYIDTAYANTNVRVFPDKQGNPILMYALLKQSLIILTNNAEALKEIKRRLQYY